MTLQKTVPIKVETPKKLVKDIDVLKYIGIATGTYGSVEEINDYIRNERASWD